MKSLATLWTLKFYNQKRKELVEQDRELYQVSLFETNDTLNYKFGAEIKSLALHNTDSDSICEKIQKKKSRKWKLFFFMSIHQVKFRFPLTPASINIQKNLGQNYPPKEARLIQLKIIYFNFKSTTPQHGYDIKSTQSCFYCQAQLQFQLQLGCS